MCRKSGGGGTRTPKGLRPPHFECGAAAGGEGRQGTNQGVFLYFCLCEKRIRDAEVRMGAVRLLSKLLSESGHGTGEVRGDRLRVAGR